VKIKQFNDNSMNNFYFLPNYFNQNCRWSNL
jgi:hypothetical protein